MRAAAAAYARLVEVEPFSDAAHRLRIELLAAGGDRAGARRAYEHCRATFAEELGVEPSAETQAALRRALEATIQAPAGEATAADIPAPEPAAPPSPFVSLSVLVVDDHDFQRRTARALLGRLGVGSLTEALEPPHGVVPARRQHAPLLRGARRRASSSRRGSCPSPSACARRSPTAGRRRVSGDQGAV